MISGIVNTQLEAVIQLDILGEKQQRQSIQAIIDTGYTGFLTLPYSIISTLNLTWYMQQEGLLGDGSLRMFNVYEASVIWAGQVRMIEVNESETDPLVGMGLLEGYELKIQATDGGLVTITALPWTANRYERKNLNNTSSTNWVALEAMDDEGIDYSDIPPLTEAFFENATLRIPASQAHRLVEIEPDVLNWFQSQGGEYKSLINSILRHYIENHREQPVA